MTTRPRSGCLLAAGLLMLAGCGSAATPHARTSASRTHAASLGVSAPGLIAFRRYLDVGKTTSAIFTVRPDGTGVRQVSHPPQGRFDTQPAISADGTRIAWEYCQNGADGSCHVMLADVNGSHAAELRVPCPHGPICDPQGPAWAPDGRLAIQLAWGDTRNEEIQRSQIVVLRPDGSERRVLVDNPPYRAETEAPVWSPDGTRIAYEFRHVAASGELSGTGVAVVSADGGRPRQLTPAAIGGGDHVDYSPDGKWIVFTTHADQDSGPHELAVVHPDGTGLHELTHYGASGSTVTSSSFSPDGSRIVFGVQRDLGQHADLFVMRTDGRDVRPLTRTERYESAPEWGRTP